MEKLYSPWRSQYIASFSDDAPSTGCVFCAAVAAAGEEAREQQDERSQLVYRGKTAFVLMNRYPYNSGHLMILPNRHTADLQSLTAEESLELQQLLTLAHRALTELLHPHGFNLGMNLGREAGAGIDTHLHWHIVPRWNGDTNFMPVLADIKMVSDDMHTQWTRLHAWFIAHAATV